MRSHKGQRDWLTWTILVGVLVSVSWSLQAAEKSKRTAEPLTATRLIAALDKLLAEQHALLRALEEIQQEVAIVKVRAATIPSGICD